MYISNYVKYINEISLMYIGQSEMGMGIRTRNQFCSINYYNESQINKVNSKVIVRGKISELKIIWCIVMSCI